jgi:simple sugar transport system ATP-binding protein
VDALFQTLRSLRDQGKTILFITHKLHEVMRLCDRATVLRDGAVRATVNVASTTPAEISRHMTGRDVMLDLVKPPGQAGETVLEIEHLSLFDEGGRPLVSDISFDIKAGEIVGIASVAGNGQTELIEALAGLRAVDAGQVRLQGADLTNASVAQRRSAGLAYVPEDRSGVGTAAGASVAENLALGFQSRPPISRHGLFSLSEMRRYASRLIRQYAIKVSRPEAPAVSLSGGNLQKVVLARELEHRSTCLIAEQPTRGLDIGAIEFVHQQLLRYREEGHAILLVSAELSEILSLSDRILVMLEGRIVGEVPGLEATEVEQGQLMTGAHESVIARAVGSVG